MDVYDEYATFVTDYLNEKERYVGYLASLCAGLEVPFMVILGILSAKLPTRTLLILVLYLVAHFTLVLVYLKFSYDACWTNMFSHLSSNITRSWD